MSTLLLLVAGCAAPQPEAVNVRDGRGYCPICHEWHDDGQMRYPVTMDGRTYRFCDPNCAAAFKAKPEKYLSDATFNPKP
jgi:YHS domain-containing protein